jgi:hypothetical protein
MKRAADCGAAVTDKGFGDSYGDWSYRGDLFRVCVMPMRSLAEAAGVFDAVRLRRVCDAFDSAWASLQQAGPIDHDQAPAIREKLAKRIVEMALGDSALHVDELREDALAYLRNNPAD